MNLSEYFQRLQAKLNVFTPNDESVLVLFMRCLAKTMPCTMMKSKLISKRYMKI